METAILDWLNLGARLLHVIAGIAWIGASFYFIWLDNSLQPPPEEKAKRGVSGDLWAIHGGGIYEVAKYRLAPPVMPEHLHWFKWEAYTTWLSGALLLCLLYYLQAELYLLGGPWIEDPRVAIGASILFLAGTLGVYELAMRSPLRGRPLSFALFVLLLATLLAWLADQLFAARAAWLHVGAALATIMAANVFLGIIPSQRRFVAAVARGEAPDAGAAALAKLRSTHNNYLTLPVVFTMISNHYPALYGHALSWQLLIAVGAVLAYLRHFFNLRHRGIVRPSIPIICAALLLVIFAAAQWQMVAARAGADASAPALDDAAALALIGTHCVGCHAEHPRHPGFSAAPGGHRFETLAQTRAGAALAATSIRSGYMPLGNTTDLAAPEREALVRWLEQ